MSDDILQLGNSKCSNNAAFETKDIREEFVGYFMSKEKITWQQNQPLQSFEIVCLH